MFLKEVIINNKIRQIIKEEFDSAIIYCNGYPNVKVVFEEVERKILERIEKINEEEENINDSHCNMQ